MRIERFELNPFQENCYVVSDESNEGIIIDCGAFYTEERKAIVKYVKDNNIRLKHLLATHAHIDHNFGNNTIYEAFNLKPEVYGEDEYMMSKLPQQAMMFCNYKLDYEMPPVGRLLKADDTIHVGRHTFTVIPTPGHTKGSVFFYCKEQKVAFSGDTLFKMSIGRTDFEQGSFSDIIDSLKKLKDLIEPDTVILPGHGPKTTLDYELKYNPYFK